MIVLRLQLGSRIEALNASQAVAVFKALFRAEAERVGPKAEFQATNKLTNPDKGIDGRSKFPANSPARIPSGRFVWQVKSGHSPLTPAKIKLEVGKPGVKAALKDKCHYGLFCTRDMSDSARQEVAGVLLKAIRKTSKSARLHTMFVSEIEGLLARNPGVLGLIDFPIGTLIGSARWAEDSDSIPYVPDEPRRQTAETIRRILEGAATSPASVHVFGDAGVGKSRLAKEAVRGAGGNALYAAAYGDSVDEFLAELQRSPTARASLIVDDCSSESVRRLHEAASRCAGRLRLVTIGPREDRAALTDGSTLEVRPLESSDTERIALAEGVDADVARLIAQLSGGYPRLTSELAKEVRRSAGGADLMTLLRGRRIADVLDRMLPDKERRRHLGVLALFRRVGFSGDKKGELSALCDSFGLNVSAVERTIFEETDRYVSRGIQYCNVTPRVFAFWLAERVLGELGHQVMPVVRGLSDGLWEAFADQLETIGAAEGLATRIKEVLDNEETFREDVGRLSPRDAEFLRSAAIAVPETVGQAIDRMINASSLDVLRNARSVRRALVWTCQYLLWHEDVAARGIRALAKLAAAENETWANNATGILQQSCQIKLGGTCLPYSQRLEVIHELLDEKEIASVVIEALSHALKGDETRSEGLRGLLRDYHEWQPATWSEGWDARLGAVAAVMEGVQRWPELETKAADVIASGLYTLARVGIVERALPLVKREWGSEARRSLWLGARHAVWYVELDEGKGADAERVGKAKEQLLQFEEAIGPRDNKERAGMILKTSWWDMVRPTSMGEDADRAIELAREWAGMDLEQITSVFGEITAVDPETAWRVFGRLGELRPERDLVEAMWSAGENPIEAIRGLLTGAARSGAAWIDDELKTWLAGPEKRDHLIGTLHLLPATSGRAALALQAIAAGSPAGELGRLLYGAWVRGLDEESAVAIIEALMKSGGIAGKRNAPGILHQWVSSKEGEPSARVRALIRKALRASIGQERDGMVAQYRSLLRPLAKLTPLAEARLCMDAIRSEEGFPEKADLSGLRQASAADPERVCELVIDTLLVGMKKHKWGGWPSWAEEGHLLSVLEDGAGADAVLRALEARSHEEIAWLMKHYDFRASLLGPLPRALILRIGGKEIAKAMTQQAISPRGVISGDLGDYYFARQKAAEALAANDESPKVRAWAKKTARAFDSYVQMGRVVDEEHD